MNKTTYLFGAGASYNSIPTVVDMVKHMPVLIQKLKDSGYNNSGITKKKLEPFIKALEEINDSLNYTQTPDATLRRFYQKGNFKYYLAVYWIYLNLIQFVIRDEIGLTEDVIGRSLNSIDRRYSQFIAEEFYDDPHKFHFLSWNYDTQLEQSLQAMFNLKDLNSVYNQFHVYPSPVRKGTELPLIVHLNGTSAVYQFDGNKKHNIQEGISNISQGTNLIDALSRLLWIIERDKLPQIKLENTLKFSFTFKNNDLPNLEHVVHDILQNTAKLIVVGYSFPRLNRNIDSILLGHLPLNTEIILQNPVSHADRVHEWFKIERNRIRIETENMDNFIAE